MQVMQQTIAPTKFDKRKNLINFFKDELVNLGTDSLSELARRIQQSNISISTQKLWRWNQEGKEDIPDWDDLEKLAQWKRIPLPEFLVKHLGYEPVNVASNIEAILPLLSTSELSELLLKGNMLLNKRISSQKQMRTTPEQVRLLQQVIIRAMLKDIRHLTIAEVAGVEPSDITAVARDPQGISFELSDFQKIVSAIAQLSGNQEVVQMLSRRMTETEKSQVIDLALRKLLDENGALTH